MQGADPKSGAIPCGSAFVLLSQSRPEPHPMTIPRRTFLHGLTATGVAAAAPEAMAEPAPETAGDETFRLRYLLPSCMYGYADLAEILPEVPKIGADAIDLWPKVHGNQREQLDEMGEERFREMLAGHGVSLGCLTQYPLGPFGLAEEFRLAKRFGCPLIVTGGAGPKGLRGTELKAAVRDFVEKLRPHLELAADAGVTLAIENHGNNLMESPDSLKWLAEFRPDRQLGIALAPYHLPQDETLLAGLIRDLGDAMVMFYAWQHGTGSTKRQPKRDELKQLPGRGSLDFGPLLRALRDIRYAGRTEIFMHPFPRGIPILETTDEVTAEINRARRYLENRLNDSAG